MTSRSILLRWLVATLAFPAGGFIGHLIAGPAATVPAALISGLIAGTIIGLGQGLAMRSKPQPIVEWAATTAVGMGIGLAAVTAIIGQIDSLTDAALLGAVSGLAIGALQAALLIRDRVGNALLWVVATAVAWAVGWSVTASVGVALAAGWPVYGISGAIASQLITGVVLWKLMSPSEVPAPAPA
jgi:hypothetical protein